MKKLNGAARRWTVLIKALLLVLTASMKSIARVAEHDGYQHHKFDRRKGVFSKLTNNNSEKNEKATRVKIGLRTNEEIDEYLRTDSAFRVVCASYAIMLEDLVGEREFTSERTKRMILNLQADLRFKAARLMKLSPTLKTRAEGFLHELKKEVR